MNRKGKERDKGQAMQCMDMLGHDMNHEKEIKKKWQATI